MIGFVDDTRKFNNCNTRGDSISDNVCLVLNEQQNVSYIISGKLNVKKCGYYTLMWKCNTRGYLEMCNDDEGEVHMTEEDGQVLVKKFQNN